MSLIKKIAVCTALLSTSAFADVDGAFLSPAFKNLKHPVVDKANMKNFNYKSDTQNVVNKMTSVKSQGSRGTCSIFSAAALIEGHFVINGIADREIDLSEEYLEYLVISTQRRTSDGSYTSKNLDLVRRYGIPRESVLPYVSDNWEKSETALEIERCSHLVSDEKKMCELGHFDPNLVRKSEDQLNSINAPYIDDYIAAKKDAEYVKSRAIRYASNYYISYASQVKSYLSQGKPVILDQTFYYGAWNHSRATTYGIGRDMNNWNQGIVGHPEPGSMDIKKSKENPAGHSVLLVGYDDNKVVKTNVLMQDGTYKEFTYKGVYYFKNSWGTGSFGSQAVIDGQLQPGYGIMVQKYAHTYGSFYTIK